MIHILRPSRHFSRKKRPKKSHNLKSLPLQDTAGSAVKKRCWCISQYLLRASCVPTPPSSWPGQTTNSIFVCFLFVKKPGGQINDASSEKHYFLWFLPATPSSPSWTLEGFFEPTRRPSRALTRLVRCFQNSRNCRTLSGVPGCRKGPWTPSRTTGANFDCAFVADALFYTGP